MDGFSDYAPLLAKLGKHKTGKSCLYVNRLSDIDVDVLGELIDGSVRYTSEQEAKRAGTRAGARQSGGIEKRAAEGKD